MDVADLLLEAHGRVPDLCEGAVSGLTPEQLLAAPTEGANPIGWLVWHLARVEDGHVAELLPADQVWTEPGWAERFGLDPDPTNSGWGHTPEQVAAVRPESTDALLEYLHEVRSRTIPFLRGLSPADLDRVVDEHWDPPVTLGVRLVSIIDDQVQHAGQAAYARGLLGF